MEKQEVFSVGAALAAKAGLSDSLNAAIAAEAAPTRAGTTEVVLSFEVLFLMGVQRTFTNSRLYAVNRRRHLPLTRSCIRDPDDRDQKARSMKAMI